MARLVARIPGLIQVAIHDATPVLKTTWKYSKSELRPPTPSDIGPAISGVGRLISAFGRSSWRKVTVKEALLNTLVTVEVTCWFFVGEVIGRRHLIGYEPGYGYKHKH